MGGNINENTYNLYNDADILADCEHWAIWM